MSMPRHMAILLARGWVFSLALALVAFFGFGIQSGFGQGGRASISGTVTEQTGAVVPDTKIVVTDTVTGQAREVVTTESGTYVVPLLPVGNFSVTCSHPGFKSETRTGVKLTADEKATVDFSLAVGEVTQTIEVSAGAEVINTTNGAIGQVVEQTAIVELPLNGRNPAELVFLAPGAVDGFKFGGFTRQEFTTFPTETAASVNGGRQGSTYYMLDGSNNMDNYHNNATPFPNSDATQEFRVLTNNFDAQYGFSPGAVVSIVTRSGGKDWHGDAFEFIRNDILNARDFFARDRDTLKRNQFGASAGGSIIKDKLFIFGNYQGTTERRRVNGGSTYVPNNKMIAGDFSDLLPGTQITDPDTGLPVPGNIFTPDQWATKFNPVAKNFLDVLPRTDDPSGLVSLSGAVRVRDYHEFTIKPDWYLSPKHHISGRVFFDNFTHPKEGGGGNILLTDRSWTARYQNYGGNWLYTIRPNLIHNLVFSYNRLNTYSIPGFETKDGGPVCFKCFGSKVEEYPTTAPNLMLIFGPNWATQNTNYINRHNISISDSISWTKGKHLIVAGVDILRQSWDLGTDWLADEIFQFDGNRTKSWFSDFLTGKASMFWQGAGSFDLIKGTSWSGYGQDTIRLKPNLTLGLGLRWEPYFPYEVSNGRIPMFQPGQQSTRYPNAPTGLVYPGDAGVPDKGAPSDATTFSPRISIAWQPKAFPNTSIRAAFGFFIAPLALSTYNHVADSAPFAPSFQVLANDPAVGKSIPFEDPWSVYAPTGFKSPFPPFASSDYAPPADAPFVLPVFVQEHFSNDFRIGKVQSWNLSVEHQFANDILIRAAYVGSEGYHLPNVVERNPGFFSANGARPLYSPNFTNILQYVSWSTSSYNALQLTFDKRFSHGLQFTSNYAYSKNIDSGLPGGGVFAGQLPNPFDSSFGRGLSVLNHPHVWTNFWVYQLPSLKQQNALVRGVLGDWQFSGTWRLQSGDPFSVVGGFGNDRSLAHTGGDRADLTGEPITSHQGDKGEWLLHYMNLSAFTPNAPGTFGTSARNLLRGDMTNVADLGISKNFPFKERYRIQFRWEMFNAFNRPHFSNPSNNPADPSSFGRITTTKGYGAGAGGAEQDIFGIPARIMQFALKFHW
jgi:Carboxypeptidase regulatory-like domain